MALNLRVPRDEIVAQSEAKDNVRIVLTIIFVLIIIAAINAVLWERLREAQQRRRRQPAQEEHELQQPTGEPQS
ncbi:hypothetical protein K445DRAFT_19120 [Daldinia sp. EC12]|nr:hypothetical protein K445DRAFT_19120 [Daldinia sp. EC12]